MSQIGLQIGIIGENADAILLKDLNLKLVKNKSQLLKFIDKINIDPDVYFELKKVIVACPEGSLNYIAKNFRFIVETCVERALTKKNLNKMPEEQVLKTVSEIKPVKVKLPKKQPVVELNGGGTEVEIPKDEKRPKWVNKTMQSFMNDFEAKKPIPKKEEQSKSFDQIAQEVENEIDKFLDDEEFVKKLMDKNK